MPIWAANSRWDIASYHNIDKYKVKSLDEWSYLP